MRIGISYDHGTPKYRLYLGALMAAAEREGVEIVPLWLAGVAQPLEPQLLDLLDGLVLTGGPDIEPRRYGGDNADERCHCDPARDALEWQMLERALARRIPIFAICRGMQLLNVFCGGTLIPDLPSAPDHRLGSDERHPVQVDPESALGRLTERTVASVTSSHHQAVDRIGRGLQAVAWHADRTIEALAWANPLRKPWLMAVQWHPERMAPDEPLSGALYHGFLQAMSSTSVG